MAAVVESLTCVSLDAKQFNKDPDQNHHDAFINLIRSGVGAPLRRCGTGVGSSRVAPGEGGVRSWGWKGSHADMRTCPFWTLYCTAGRGTRSSSSAWRGTS